MAQITLDKIAERVKQTLGLSSNAAATATVKAVRDAIVDELEHGIKDKAFELRIHGLGTFKTEAIAAKMGRNPSTGLAQAFPARTKLKFKLTQGLANLGK